MTDNEIIKALEYCEDSADTDKHCLKCPYCNESYCLDKMMADALDLINRQKAEIEKLTKDSKRLKKVEMQLDDMCKMYHIIKSEAVKEFAEKIDELLKRYSHLHKRADEARRSTEEYADGTPMEMVSVWEVLSLKKWEMADYENMNALQDNIETIAIERLLTEIEIDFKLLEKEMTADK